MDMDEMRTKWAEFDRKLEKDLRINQHLLRLTYVGKTKTALRWLAAGTIAECIFDLPILWWLGGFMYKHWGQMPYFLPALGLYFFVLASFIIQIRQVVLALTLDYSGSIANMQKQLGTLRVSRIRHTQAIFLTVPLLWVPLQIVVLKALGVDAYKLLPPVYLWMNVAVGLACIPLMLWISRTFVAHLGHTPFFQELMRDLAGNSLVEASKHLETLKEFEEEGEAL